MNVDVLYTHGKLGEAVEILARHPGRIKERLTEAVQHALVMVNREVFSQPGMNADASGYWQKIWAAVTTAPQDPERGVYGPSIERLTEDEASRVAQLIVSLDAMVSSAVDEQ